MVNFMRCELCQREACSLDEKSDWKVLDEWGLFSNVIVVQSREE